MSVPPLLHIGYHKTGTSWLQSHLFPPKSRCGFRTCGSEFDAKRELVRPHDLEFDPQKAYAFYGPRFDRVAAEGLVPVVSAERLCGDTLFGAYDSALLANRLAATFPDGRVLIVIREQRAVIYSNYQEYVGSGGLLQLDQYLRRPKRAHPWPCDLGHFAYDALISHYHRLFGPENVLVLPYELFRSEPGDFIRRIITFAGATPEPGAVDELPFGVVVNRSWPAQTIVAKRYANHVLRSRLNPWAPISDRKKLGQSLKKQLIRKSRRLPRRFEESARTKMRATIAAAAADRYRESNDRTSDLIGIDLGEVGYDVARPASAESLAGAASTPPS